MRRYRLFLLFLCLISTLVTHAQTHNHEVWTDASVSYKLLYNLSVEGSVEARFNELSSLKAINGEFGLTYNITKPISVSLSYKGAEKLRNQGFFITHSGIFSAAYKTKINNLRIGYRNKTVVSRNMYINELSDLYPTYENRNRIKLSYSQKKAFITPVASVESIHTLHQPRLYAIEEMRYAGGLEFRLAKKLELTTLYTHKQNFGKKPSITSVYSLSIAKKF